MLGLNYARSSSAQLISSRFPFVLWNDRRVNFCALSLLLSFLPVIYLRVPRIFLDCAQIVAVSVFLKRRFSCFCRLAHVFLFFSFFFSPLFARCALVPSPSLAPSRSLSSLSPRTRASVLARAVAAPLNWIFPVSFASYCTRCHSTYGCQRSRGFSPPTSHLARQRQPCVRTFFSVRRIFAIRESGFLSDPYSCSRSPSMHQSVVPVVRFLPPR